MRESKHITNAKMRVLLREAYREDPEKSVLRQLARHLRDPSRPRELNNHPRVHPLWLALGLIAAFVVGVFAYFSLQSLAR